MHEINSKNERIKRQFFIWLTGAGGCCEATVNVIEEAILLYQDFTKQADFSTFSNTKATGFKEWLLKRKFKGKNIALATYNNHLRNLRKFFLWLASQEGYKSKINLTHIDYLRISKKEERIATQSTPRKFPPIEYVIKLAESIKINSEVDLRDRAIIAFTLLSGMRDKAIATLPLGCFDEALLGINQDPKQGVQTKFSKHIPTTLLSFNENLLGYFLEWVKHLKGKGFGSGDPLFPHSKLQQVKDGLAFEAASTVEPIYWQSAGRIREIFKQRSQEAGVLYYPPHTFRHLAIDLALKSCKNGEQIKAISQNFGHEHIATTLSSYANYAPDRLSEIIANMDFSGKPSKSEEKKIEEIKKILLD